jgi:hypothetical protein
MAYAWIYVINNGSGTPNIVRTSHSGTTVAQIQPGEYVVTFPIVVAGLAAVGSLGNSVGTITVVPGENSGLSPNQVRVLTLTLQNQLIGSYDFNLAVFYPARWPWWPWVVGALLAAAALFLFRR